MKHEFVKAIKMTFDEFEEIVSDATDKKGCVIYDQDGWCYGTDSESDIDGKEIPSMIETYLNLSIDKIVVDCSTEDDESIVVILIRK